jgi:hypothetical protein
MNGPTTVINEKAQEAFDQAGFFAGTLWCGEITNDDLLYEELTDAEKGRP